MTARTRRPTVSIEAARGQEASHSTDEPRHLLRSFLASKGLKSSENRAAVVRAFLASTGHVDLRTLLDAARRLHDGVSYTTVYRTMKLLEEAGIATAHRFDEARGTVFEVAVGRAHHDHLICETCGRIAEFLNPDLESTQDEIAADLGFSLTHHRHELYGTCAPCRRTARSTD